MMLLKLLLEYGEPVVLVEKDSPTITTTVVQEVTSNKESLSLQVNNSLLSLVKVVNKVLTTVEMADGQMVVMEPKAMLLVQVAVVSPVSGLVHGKLELLLLLLVQAAAVATVKVVPVAVKLVATVKVEMDNLQEDLNLLVALEDLVYQVLNTLVVTVTQEDNNKLKPWTAEEVVLVTSVAKAVLLMLEVVLVVQDSVKETDASTLKVLLVVVSVKDQLLLQ
jgi:hypothetical protein